MWRLFFPKQDDITPRERWTSVTELDQFPSGEELFKFGTWPEFMHLMKILYDKNLEVAKKNENRDPS